MNIFVLHRDPRQAAVVQIDKHIVKMPLETAQLLSTAVAHHSGSKQVDGCYRPTHVNHPCSVWTRENRANYLWLAEHGLALCAEYRRRYGREHKSKEVILNCLAFVTRVPQGQLTPFAQAMPDEYRREDAVDAYRAYYIGAKRPIASWKSPATPPNWWDANTTSGGILCQPREPCF